MIFLLLLVLMNILSYSHADNNALKKITINNICSNNSYLNCMNIQEEECSKSLNNAVASCEAKLNTSISKIKCVTHNYLKSINATDAKVASCKTITTSDLSFYFLDLDTPISKLMIEEIDYVKELHSASISGNTDKINLLISKGISLEEKAPYPLGKYKAPTGTPLHWAAESGNIKAVKFLIKKGANVNALTWYGDNTILETPLENAVFRGHSEIVNILLKSGANIEGSGHSFHWPLQIAASSGRLDILDILLNHGARINRSEIDGYTALHHAIFDNKINAVEFLLTKGADSNYRDERFEGNSQSPLELAQQKNNKAVIDLLIKYGAK